MSAEDIRRSLFFKKGLELNISILGEMNTGKSTFINCLCNSSIVPLNGLQPIDFEIKEYHAILEEENTKISLNIMTCAGLINAIDNSNSIDFIVDYYKEQFEKTLKEESKVNRNPKAKDCRIHATIYFIRPTGKGLREIDIEIMKQISNIIPVISKADLLTAKEVKLNRELIMKDINENEINIYDFSDSFGDNESLFTEYTIKNLIPFAIISGMGKKVIDDVEIRVRHVSHGFIKIDDPEHSDFIILKKCLLGAGPEDLKESTQTYYENYRTEILSRRDC
ncbi:hypothetical protein DAMA08_030630 [Martiniozyma asiatica (nom. inval.)]|nr:hypothetical protein DAMA08_030630 [Martiniozyma asiatica]